MTPMMDPFEIVAVVFCFLTVIDPLYFLITGRTCLNFYFWLTALSNRKNREGCKIFFPQNKQESKAHIALQYKEDDLC